MVKSYLFLKELNKNKKKYQRNYIFFAVCFFFPSSMSLYIVYTSTTNGVIHHTNFRNIYFIQFLETKKTLRIVCERKVNGYGNERE
jgi:hypothetical protein